MNEMFIAATEIGPRATSGRDARPSHSYLPTNLNVNFFSAQGQKWTEETNRRERDPRQATPAMLALSPQLLQPDAPQPPPTPHRASISTSALSDASMVSSNDQQDSSCR